MRIYLGLGSNIDRVRYIRTGVHTLQAMFGELTLSPVYESPAEGFAGDSFYNMVVGLDTTIDISKLSAQLKQIEADCGRVKSAEKFADRTLDIDILLYGDAILHDDGYDIPRDEILRYAFVLKPLADIAGEIIHPQQQQTIATLWQQFPKPVSLKVVELEFN
jgi:2-amino-4-hydroxy-6-hydroxymethyldihydropteridine diphosphokinase